MIGGGGGEKEGRAQSRRFESEGRKREGLLRYWARVGSPGKDPPLGAPPPTANYRVGDISSSSFALWPVSENRGALKVITSQSSDEARKRKVLWVLWGFESLTIFACSFCDLAWLSLVLSVTSVARYTSLPCARPSCSMLIDAVGGERRRRPNRNRISSKGGGGPGANTGPLACTYGSTYWLLFGVSSAWIGHTQLVLVCSPLGAFAACIVNCLALEQKSDERASEDTTELVTFSERGRDGGKDPQQVRLRATTRADVTRSVQRGCWGRRNLGTVFGSPSWGGHTLSPSRAEALDTKRTPPAQS